MRGGNPASGGWTSRWTRLHRSGHEDAQAAIQVADPSPEGAREGAGPPPRARAAEPNGSRCPVSTTASSPGRVDEFPGLTPRDGWPLCPYSLGSPPPSDLRTGSTSGQDRMRPRKRHGVPMRTPSLGTCAPARRRKLLSAKALRLAVPDGRGRREREGRAGSDPAVRGTAAGSGPGAFAHPRPLPLGSLPDLRSLRGKAVRAPLRGGGPPVRRLTGCGAVRHQRARPGRARPGSPFGLPARDCWNRERPQARVGWPCTSQPSPCRMRHAEYGGRSRQRPPAPARHGRPRGYATNATTPATCRICGVSRPSAVLVHIDPDVSRTPLDRQRPPLMGDQIPPSEKRLERHTVKRSIIASEGAVGSAARSPASRVRQSRIPP